MNLGPTLAKHGLGPDKLKLMIHDDQRSRMINYTYAILSDKLAAKYVSGIAFHWYDNNFAGPKVLDQIANQFHNYFILNTESSFIIGKRPKEDLPLGNWENGERYAYDIITVYQLIRT